MYMMTPKDQRSQRLSYEFASTPTSDSTTSGAINSTEPTRRKHDSQEPKMTGITTKMQRKIITKLHEPFAVIFFMYRVLPGVRSSGVVTEKSSSHLPRWTPLSGAGENRKGYTLLTFVL